MNCRGTNGNCSSEEFTSQRQMAAALRVAVAAANHGHLMTLCSFLLRPLSNTITNKALNHNRNLKGLSRKRFTCRAVYNPEEVQIKEEEVRIKEEEVQIKEEGQSESPEYRVFLVDRSCKKVLLWFCSNKYSYSLPWL